MFGISLVLIKFFKNTLVDVKFNSYKIIPLYYNNKFTLHMHTFSISIMFFNPQHYHSLKHHIHGYFI
jgi:hypothetical protein